MDKLREQIVDEFTRSLEKMSVDEKVRMLDYLGIEQPDAGELARMLNITSVVRKKPPGRVLEFRSDERRKLNGG